MFSFLLSFFLYFYLFNCFCETATFCFRYVRNEITGITLLSLLFFSWSLIQLVPVGNFVVLVFGSLHSFFRWHHYITRTRLNVLFNFHKQLEESGDLQKGLYCPWPQSSSNKTDPQWSPLPVLHHQVWLINWNFTKPWNGLFLILQNK